MSDLRITDEQDDALKSSAGLVHASGPSGEVILMSLPVYRELMGLATEADLDASVAALEASLEQARQGQTRPLTDCLDELGRKHEVSG